MDRRDFIKKTSIGTAIMAVPFGLTGFSEKPELNIVESFYDFYQYHYPSHTNWHIRYLCDLMDGEVKRMERGEPKNKDYIINMPPRCGSTSIFSVCLPAWVNLRKNRFNFLNLTYDSTLAFNAKNDLSNLMARSGIGFLSNHRSYLNVLDNKLNPVSHALYNCELSNLTGYGADYTVFDNPQDFRQIQSDRYRECSVNYYSRNPMHRLRRQDVGFRVIVTPRLHKEDLTAFMLSTFPGKWNHIVLPAMRWNSEEVSYGIEYDVKKHNQDSFVTYLDNERLGKEVLKHSVDTIGAESFNHLYQQMPYFYDPLPRF